MSKTLTAVARAAKARHQAYDRYRAAIQEAHADGCTLAQIADAAGITISGAHYLVRPDARKQARDDEA